MTVAVVVLRVFQVTGGHELGLAEGAGPRAFQAGQIYVTAIDDLERGEELGTEEGRAARIVGQRGQCRDGRANAGEAAEIGFEPPHRDHDPRRDAVLLADLGEEGALPGVEVLRRTDQPRRQPALQVLIELQGELGLRAIALEDRLDRLFDVGERRVDDLRPDAARERFGPQRRQPFAERRREWRDGRDVLR